MSAVVLSASLHLIEVSAVVGSFGSIHLYYNARKIELQWGVVRLVQEVSVCFVFSFSRTCSTCSTCSTHTPHSVEEVGILCSVLVKLVLDLVAPVCATCVNVSVWV